MKNLINIFTFSLLMVCSLFLNQSCTMYDTPGEIADDGGKVTEISTRIHRRVLWINLDGATGAVVKNAIPGNGAIAKMLKNSKYSWIGLSENRVLAEEKNEDPVTWASLLTGVIPEKHHVTDDSYAANVDYNPGNPTEKIIHYPNIIHHITSTDISMLTLCITPWEKLNKNMLNNAKTTITSENDAQTRELALKHLTDDDYTFILLSFSGMLEAGKNGGFKEENTNYVNALRTIDGYIGEFLEAIAARENAFFEDWLVVLTSNHGGTPDGHYGGNSEAERNTFGLFYYSHYTEQLMRGQKLYGAYFNQNLTRAIAFDTIASYSLNGNPFSMEIIMRMTPKKDGTYNGNNWDRFLGKNGWGLFRQRSTVSFRIPSSPVLEQAATGFNDAQWHNYGFSIGSQVSGARPWIISFDGKTVSTGTHGTPGVPLDSSFLTIGNSGLPTAYYLSEIRLWKKALTDPEFVQQASLLDLDSSDPRFQDLLAYWVFKPSEVIETDNDTLVVKNRVPGGFNMYYANLNKADKRPVEQVAFSELANTLPVYKTTGNLIMENTLVVPQILYWLGISTTTVLDGFRFLDNYTPSEEWRDDPDIVE